MKSWVWDLTAWGNVDRIALVIQREVGTETRATMIAMAIQEMQDGR